LPYTEVELCCLLSDLSDALLFAKFQGIAHRDIKPANIFLQGRHCKLGDFGSARLTENTKMDANGTAEYLSPEMRRRALGELIEIDLHQSDMYSLGVTLLHIAKLELPTSVAKAWENPHSLQQSIQFETSTLLYSEPVLSLIKQMLRFEPQERPQIESIRKVVLAARESPSTNLLDQAWDSILQERFAEAETHLLTAVLGSRVSSVKQVPELCGGFAFLYLSLGRFSESRKMLETLRSTEMANDEVITEWHTLAIAYRSEGRREEAEAALRQCLSLEVALHGPDTLMVAYLYSALGLLCRQAKRVAEAEEYFRASVVLGERTGGQNCELTGSLLLNLGGLYLESGNLHLAEDAYSRGLAIFQMLYGKRHSHIVEASANLAISRSFVCCKAASDGAN
ncbi:MAG: tetratricopeptide repeat protein, partial [Actinobacteria bacterium]|nr:tetratricopeptide repeat protein [Actinomycetota bacterium]